VWFVDAHLGVYPDLVRRTALVAHYSLASVSHHLGPETLLALAQQLYGQAPAGELISIRGFDFDFGDELSAQTAEGVRQVVEELGQRLAAARPDGA